MKNTQREESFFFTLLVRTFLSRHVVSVGIATLLGLVNEYIRVQKYPKVSLSELQTMVSRRTLPLLV